MYPTLKKSIPTGVPVEKRLIKLCIIACSLYDPLDELYKNGVFSLVTGFKAVIILEFTVQTSFVSASKFKVKKDFVVQTIGSLGFNETTCQDCSY